MTSWYCVAPFRQAYIDPTGLAVCCQQERHDVDLDNWHTYQPLKELQQQFIQGQVPDFCQGCAKQEQQFGSSLRTQSNQDYNNAVFTDTKVDFIDYRSCNICNFKCRSCSPTFSHGIAREALENPVTLGKYFPVSNKFVQVTDNNHQWIIDNIPQIKRLMLTGGEPTVIPHVRRMLEQVLEKDHTDISILITTNGSFTDDFWYKLVERVPNLHWTLSIDAVGTAAEIVRHGTDWSTVEHNARWLAANASSFTVNTVITNLNVLQLSPLLKFVQSLQQNSNGRNGCDHHFFVSQRPYYLSADNLTAELKTQALAYLQECQNLNLDHAQLDILQGLIRKISNSTFDQQLWNRSVEYNSELDRLRAQDHRSLFVPTI
jgi:hypothetical protein